MTIDPVGSHRAGAQPTETAETAAPPARSSGGSLGGSSGRPGGADPARRLVLAAERTAGRWPLGRIIGFGMAALAVVLIAAIVVGAVMLSNLSRDRAEVVTTIDPAALHGSQLYAAMLNQETGVRGYLLSAQRPFLAPYSAGLAQQTAQVKALRPLLTGFPTARADLSTALSRINSWRTTYAQPAIAQVQATGNPQPGGNAGVGKASFDSVRDPLAAFQRDLSAQRLLAVAKLHSAASVLDSVGIASAVLLLLLVTALGVALRAAAITPLTRLAGDARRVADGNFDHEVDPSGPQEIHELAVDVNRMRDRIVRELSAVQRANIALEARALDLERSNSELEQFAYVASHDLQEPLRKVASFCQLLERRYYGQLDARADQYIDYAVDGAKRMQALIDDLLAFSRVGRTESAAVLVSCATALSQARVNLATEIRRTGAVIETTELPTVLAGFSLLTSLFQNLVSNAIKFRGERPPVVRISAERQDEATWLFAVADNGIGIDPEYAERIFVIFQRLHDRATYAGTGIGLAMCRKIVEHYGGSIWLDTEYHDGAKFCFTLPFVATDIEELSHE